MDNDERLKSSRPPLSSSFSMPLSLLPAETSAITAGSSSSSKVVRRTTRTRSSPVPLGLDVSEDDEDRRDSHDLSISPRAFGRESLVDNLLLSFDKFGNGDLGFDTAFFGPPSELDDKDDNTSDDGDDDDDAATTSSEQTGYSTRGRRSNSSGNHHSHLGRLPTHSSGGSRALGSADHGTAPAGYGLKYGRETFSRSGITGSTLNSFVNNNEYDPAPTPTVHSRQRDRSVTIESAAKPERRGSIKSTRSTKKLQEYHTDDKMVLPPLPAFHMPTPAPTTPVKQPKAPGFFRRVFGGGSSSSSNSNNNNNSKYKSQQLQTPHVDQPDNKPVETALHLDAATGPIPPATINKKPSFFRRRKKSLSETIPQLPQPLPGQATRDDPQFEQIESSCLRAAINPYLRTPAVPAPLDPEFDSEPTIRTVQTSEPGSPNRPTYIGESRARRDSETHFASASSSNFNKPPRPCKESKLDKHPSELTLATPSPTKKSVKEDRPQTSPHSPLSLTLSPTDDLTWPPSLFVMGNSMDSAAAEREKEKQKNMDIPNTTGRPSEVVQEKPIATVRDIELQHAQLEQQRRSSGPLNLDLSIGASLDSPKIGSSWLATPAQPSPTNTAVTPTVMLHVETGVDNTEMKSESADLGELLGRDEATESEKIYVQKIFDGDEEFVSKARAAAWLGSS